MKFKCSLAFFSLLTLPSFAQSETDCPDVLTFPKSVSLNSNPPFYPSVVNFYVISTADADSKQLSALSVGSGDIFPQATLTLILKDGTLEHSQPLPYILKKGTTYNLRMTDEPMTGDNFPGFRPRTWNYYYSYFYLNEPNHKCDKAGRIELTI